jgi:hypothetical protein
LAADDDIEIADFDAVQKAAQEAEMAIAVNDKRQQEEEDRKLAEQLQRLEGGGRTTWGSGSMSVAQSSPASSGYVARSPTTTSSKFVETTDARERFANKKGISSDQYFGLVRQLRLSHAPFVVNLTLNKFSLRICHIQDQQTDPVVQSRLQMYSGARAIGR